MRKQYIAVLLALLPLAVACDRSSDFTEPSFLHVEAIKLVPPSQGAITNESGFYTSDIVAALVYARRKGSNTLDTIGHFRLPFTTPVLINGDVDYIDIAPAVKQSGSSTALINYTFYHSIRITDTTFRVGDTLRFDTLETTHTITRDDVLMYEMFEPTEGSLLFDSVMQWRRQAPEEACSGRGYGFVPVNDSTYTVDFSIDRDFSVIDPLTHKLDPTRSVYMELDIRSDVDLKVFLVGAYLNGGSPNRVDVMNIYKCDEWTHLYINLWPTWKHLNFCNTFRVSFTAVNENLVNGEVRLDNVRILTMN